METFAGSLFSACLAGLFVWWMMRRDTRRITISSPATVEIERLRAVVDELTEALEQSAEAARQKLADTIGEARTAAGLLDRTLMASARADAPVESRGLGAAPADAAAESHAEPDFALPASAPADRAASPPDDRYGAIYALVASGVTNAVEIARRTGLGRGEVELHMGLHARNVL